MAFSNTLVDSIAQCRTPESECGSRAKLAHCGFGGKVKTEVSLFRTRCTPQKQRRQACSATQLADGRGTRTVHKGGRPLVIDPGGAFISKCRNCALTVLFAVSILQHASLVGNAANCGR